MVGNIDENSAADVSAVLGSLRAIQREKGVAILLVHHARKSPAAHPNQAYRGSSDFAAWSDSNLFLTRRADRLNLSIEHRSARSPESVSMKLEHEPAPHLVVLGRESAEGNQAEPNPLAVQIETLLQSVSRPMTTVELRKRLRRRKSDVVEAIDSLKTAGVVQRNANGWQLLTSR